MGKMVGLATLNILRTTRAMSMNFCVVNTPRCQIFIWDAKYCTRFSNSKKCTALKNRIPSPLPTPVLTRLFYSDVIMIKMFVLKHRIFFEDISNFKKWKSLIIDKKCWTLRNAALSKGNSNFATTVIITKNVEKILEKVTRKNQTYFFSTLLGD